MRLFKLEEKSREKLKKAIEEASKKDLKNWEEWEELVTFGNTTRSCILSVRFKRDVIESLNRSYRLFGFDCKF